MSVFTGLFLFILMVLYIGDPIWKERDVRISLISDALPNWVPLLSKYLGLGLAFALVITPAIGLGALLFAGAVVLSVRGSEELVKLRLQIGRHQLTRPVLTFGLARLIVFISSGSYIYYNTNVLNQYRNSKADEA